MSLTLTFFIGYVLMATAIVNDVIYLKSYDNSVVLETYLNDGANKFLVPPGRATSPNETEVITLKYKIITKTRNNKELNNSIDSILDEEGNLMAHHFVVVRPQETNFKKTTVVKFEVKMALPQSEQQ